MKIYVNNESMEVKEQTSITELLVLLGQSTGGMAVAVNRKVVQRVKWEETTLQNDDAVIIIKATCGG